MSMIKYPKEEFVSESIINFSQLNRKLTYLKQQGKTVGLCVGVFDLFHPSHALCLASAKKMCDILVVAISSNAITKKRKGKERPIFDQHLRAYILSMIKGVDYVVVTPYDRVTTISRIKPDFYVAMEDLRVSTLPRRVGERKKIEEITKIEYIPNKVLSTTQLIYNIRKIGKR